MAAEQFVIQIYSLLISWTMVVLIILLVAKIVQSLGGFGRGGQGGGGQGGGGQGGQGAGGQGGGGAAGAQGPGQVQNLQGQMNIP